MRETWLSSTAPGPPPGEDMAWIPGGSFLMGSEDFYPEEGPVRSVLVDGFWIDTKAVTAAQFRRFVRETGFVTVAERELDPADYPDADPELLVPGSLVFRKAPGPTPLTDFRAWWEYVPGASWKRPGGPGTTINGRDHHPVVQVAFEDAAAYAAWAGKELPDRSGVGVRRPRRSRWRAVRLGGRGVPGRSAGGEHLAGPLPLGEPEARRPRGHFSRGDLPSERPRPLRHGRQRLGVDDRPLRAERERRSAGVLRAARRRRASASRVG